MAKQTVIRNGKADSYSKWQIKQLFETANQTVIRNGKSNSYSKRQIKQLFEMAKHTGILIGKADRYRVSVSGGNQLSQEES